MMIYGTQKVTESHDDPRSLGILALRQLLHEFLDMALE
jgi:hypothetical protein